MKNSCISQRISHNLVCQGCKDYMSMINTELNIINTGLNTILMM